MGSAFIGIEIGGTKLQIVSGNNPSQIERRWRFTVDPRQGGEGIRSQIRAAFEEIRQTVGKPAAVGVGFGGPVDGQLGQIACSHQIAGWSGFPLRDWLRSLADAPIRIDNDANVGSLGEALQGAGRGFNPVFYVTLGSGVGGGLTLNGQIYHGAKPGESEIGHVRLDRQGTTVESRCSGWAVDARIRQLAAGCPGSRLTQSLGDCVGGEARHLAAACDLGDPLAWKIVRETAEDLAFGLSHVVHLFHPEIIVLGGGLSLVGEHLRSSVAEALPQFLMKVFLPAPRVALAALAEDAVPVGALELARQAGGDAFPSGIIPALV